MKSIHIHEIIFIFSNIKRVVQDQTAQSPWMLRDEVGLMLHGRFSQIAQVFATEQSQTCCDNIMNLVGSYDGVKRKYSSKIHFIKFSVTNKYLTLI